ncbi:MAG: neutral/alkaline non-lysosomal ceramidase N-terminal domain-containing protein [Verrucomicrobiaceae bacterium]|nr:neutral/alkaline non-lysosomal ceramidase N-terminal domain-containing protein [Verrucomicrobiaceae bacterium]
MAIRHLLLAVALPALLHAEPPPGATPLSSPAPPKSIAPHVPAHWKAAAATARITPQKLLWMAGYASRKKPAEGKVQDLFAKALALEDEQGNRLVFVTLDLIGVPQDLRHHVADRAAKDFKLPPANLVMNASHTHSGPTLRTQPLTDADKENPRARDAFEYTQKLENDIVGIIGKSIAELQPARLTWNKARCGFAMNRRRDYSLPAEHPNANKAPNPDGVIDHEVPALRVEAPDGTLRATLFGYACHNTSLGFYNYCGDYAGFAQQYLQEFRPGFTALFLMGCGADQNPYPRRSDVVPGITDLELSMQHGRSLSNAVEMALTVNPRPIAGPIRAAYEEIKLSYANAKRADHDYPVQVIRIGNDLTFITLGSEVVVDYSLRFKKEFAGAAGIWVAGYSNDYTGYVPSLRVLKEGGYEAAAGWAEDVEDRIASKVHQLHQQLSK